MVDRDHRSYIMTFAGYETWVDYIILDMVNSYVILVMNWLAPYNSILDCYAKTVT